MATQSTQTVQTITPGELTNLVIHGKAVALIDVRTPAEFRDAHVAFARNIPLDRLDPEAIMQGLGESEYPLYFICRTGGRAQKACEMFHNAGFTNVANVEGGTLACEQDGLPIIHGKKILSVERQARLVGGFVLVLSAVLAWFVHPAFIALAALVGIEQVVAGLIDKSPFCMILSKTPWNRCSDCAIAEICCTKP